MQRDHTPPREARVVHLRRLPRRPCLRELPRIPRGVERGQGDLVDPDVVRVRIELPVLRVGDDHLRPFHADEADEAPDGFFERCVREVVGASVDLGARASRSRGSRADAPTSSRWRPRSPRARPAGPARGRRGSRVCRRPGSGCRPPHHPCSTRARPGCPRRCSARPCPTPSTPRRRGVRAPRADTADCRHDRPGIASRPTLSSLRWSIRFPAVRRFPIVAAAVGTLLGLLGAPPASAALIARNSSSATSSSTSRAAAASTLGWKKCGGGIQCATLGVPVDYRTPGGQMVDIAVARLPATDPGHRIGSLVVNYGGPGDPGTQTLRLAGKTIPAAVRARFDIVSFDPRGTGASKPIDCIDDPTADRLYAEDPTPDTPADLTRFYAGTNTSVDLVKACIDKFGTWLAEVGTRNVARDLERLRARWATRSSPTSATRTEPSSAPCTPRCTPSASGPWSSTPPSTSPTLPSRRSSATRRASRRRSTRSSPTARPGPRAASTPTATPQPRSPRSATASRAGCVSRPPTGAAPAWPPSTSHSSPRSTTSSRAGPRSPPRCRRPSRATAPSCSCSPTRYTGRDAKGHYDNIQEAIGSIRCADRDDAKESFDSYRNTFEQYSTQFPLLGRLVGGSPIGCDPRLPSGRAR